MTALRRTFARARLLSAEQQLGECVDQLQYPELLAQEILDAYREMNEHFGRESQQAPGAAEPSGSAGTPAATLVEDHFWETRELNVHGGNSFTCIATNLQPLPLPLPLPEPQDASDSSANGLSSGVDYVGLTCERDSALVLGAVQAPGDESPYPLMLRLLACLTEIAPPAQLARIDREHLRGIAGDSPRFDLNLVLWDQDQAPEIAAITQLTRDLAEKVKDVLRQMSGAPLLRDIVCLQMNPSRFQGRLRFNWRV